MGRRSCRSEREGTVSSSSQEGSRSSRSSCSRLSRRSRSLPSSRRSRSSSRRSSRSHAPSRSSHVSGFGSRDPRHCRGTRWWSPLCLPRVGPPPQLPSVKRLRRLLPFSLRWWGPLLHRTHRAPARRTLLLACYALSVDDTSSTLRVAVPIFDGPSTCSSSCVAVDSLATRSRYW